MAKFDRYAAASRIFKLDRWLRSHLDDEEIFEFWLTFGLPDGTDSIRDTLEYIENEHDYCEFLDAFSKTCQLGIIHDAFSSESI